MDGEHALLMDSSIPHFFTIVLKVWKPNSAISLFPAGA